MPRPLTPLFDHARAMRHWPVVLGVILIIAAAASRLWFLPLRFSADPNEGWNAYQTVRAIGPGPLYPPPGSLFGNNYPPLSFYIVGALGRAIGDPIIAGRCVALASVLGIAGLLYAILHRLGARGPARATAPLLFLALNATILRDYAALDDPQWLGHLLVTAGVLVILPRSKSAGPQAGRVILAALLMLLGGLTKQNLVGWPIAVTLWLGWHHRRSLAWWIGAGLIGVVVALIACNLAFGPNFLADVLGTERIYSIERIVSRAGGALLVMALLLWWSWPIARRRPIDSRIDLIRLALLVTVPLGIIERGGDGVHFNAHFEAAIALCLSAALAFDERVASRAGRLAASLAVAALFVAGFALEIGEVRKFPTRYAAWQDMTQRIAAVRGAVACETQALCFWAGQPFGIDFFLYSQHARKSGDTRAIDLAFARHQFAAVQIDPPPPANRARAPDFIPTRLAATMKPVFVDASGRSLLMPRP